ncbi:MAG: DUF2225 domain-containing protein [SAR324 cluster bacterium]|nr:DUF2225 domain-containing protein [SAR324 cluster bacterium]
MSASSHPRKAERKNVRSIVQLMGANYNDNVICQNISIHGCMVLINTVLNPHTLVNLRFYGKKTGGDGHDLYDMLTGKIKWYRRTGRNKGVIGVEFTNPANENHGIIQILDPGRFVKEVKRLHSKSNSVMGSYVKCYVCGHKEVHQWKLRAKSMLSATNIFGIPVYTEPLVNKDFCDFNMLRVTVCPSCFFASGRPDYFQKTLEDTCPFDSGTFYKQWMSTLEDRKKIAGRHKDALFSDTRGAEQALAAYDLAIASHSLMVELTGSYEESRNIIMLGMLQAEIYMSTGDRKSAENNLSKALTTLEKIFGHLEGEAIIRAALLLCLIYLYFKNMKEFGSYMSFLFNYDQDGKVDPNSSEGKVLKQCKDTLNKSYEYRDELNKDKLSNFHFDF